jgi:Asp-tRNA(Asn)/Glu-tRNA(Gln) amidotransferase C subunit
VNRLDPDEPGPVLTLDEVLMNAPAREGDFIAVPKVLGGDSA